MRLVLVIAAVTLLLPAGTASAATPASPLSGSSFTTIDEIPFVADAVPGEPDFSFVFSAGETLNTTRYLALHGDVAPDYLNLDLGWLATKFDHIGAYSWALCPSSAPPDYTPDMSQCSPQAHFSIRFNLTPLWPADARAAARWVMNHRFRSHWRGLSGRKVSCRAVDGFEHRCRVSGFAGDSVLAGRITVYQRRVRTWSETYFRGRVRLINEYCHLVSKRPLSECQKVRRRSGRVHN